MRWLGLILAILLGTTGCRTAPQVADQLIVARFFIESADDHGVRAVLPVSETAIVVSVKPVLTEFDVVRVEVAQVELGRCLLFQLTPAAARDLHRLSGAHQGRRLVLMVDGQALGARRIDAPLAEGDLFIFVETPDEELPALQRRLATTALQLQRAAKRL